MSIATRCMRSCTARRGSTTPTSPCSSTEPPFVKQGVSNGFVTQQDVVPTLAALLGTGPPATAARPAAAPGARGDESTAARAGAVRSRRHAGGLLRYLRRRAPDALAAAAGRRVVRQRPCDVRANADRGRPREHRDGRGTPRPWPRRQQAVQSGERQAPGGLRRTKPRRDDGAYPRRRVEHRDGRPGNHHWSRRRNPRHSGARRAWRVRA